MTPQLWVTIIAAIVGSGGFTALITYLLTAAKERKAASGLQDARAKAIGEAVMMLVLSELQTRCRRIISAGERTTIESKQLIKLRNIYKSLGGDGWADDLYEGAMEQPLTEAEITNGGTKHE